MMDMKRFVPYVPSLIEYNKGQGIVRDWFLITSHKGKLIVGNLSFDWY